MVRRDALFKPLECMSNHGKILKIFEYMYSNVNYSRISFLMGVLIMYYLVHWVETGLYVEPMIV